MGTQAKLLDDGFTEFWNAYPRRIGKLAARKAYDKAQRAGATQAELLVGIRRYIEWKPGYADFCHPATWLNQGRWMDDYGTSVPRASVTDWFEECKQIHGGACGLDRFRHYSRKQLEEHAG